MDTKEPTFSTPSKLADLEAVVNTRTPVWDIKRTGDVRVKLDTDVNGQEWYVINDDSCQAAPFEGEVPCRAFPHWNGAHDQFRYEPVAFCFKTFAALLGACPIDGDIWAYNVEEYDQRVEMLTQQQEQAEPDAKLPRTVEMSEREYREYQSWLTNKRPF